MDAERFLHNEENRGDVYKLLSRCYYLPGEDTIARVDELTESLERISPETAGLITNVDTGNEIEQLKLDFSRLFVGPFKLLAPPYGSIYLESGRRVMGGSTVDARNKYREAGLDFSDQIKEAPDHIAIELEFMYYLIFKETEAIATFDDKNVLFYQNKQKEFLAKHLGVWVSDFANEVEKNATTDFYKNLARVTRIFVHKDQGELSKMSFAEPAVS